MVDLERNEMVGGKKKQSISGRKENDVFVIFILSVMIFLIVLAGAYGVYVAADTDRQTHSSVLNDRRGATDRRETKAQVQILIRMDSLLDPPNTAGVHTRDSDRIVIETSREEEIKSQYEKCLELVKIWTELKDNSKSLSNIQKLSLYGPFKQISKKFVKRAANPHFWLPAEYMKWEEHRKYEDFTDIECMQKYVELFKKFYNVENLDELYQKEKKTTSGI